MTTDAFVSRRRLAVGLSLLVLLIVGALPRAQAEATQSAVLRRFALVAGPTTAALIAYGCVTPGRTPTPSQMSW